VRDVGLRGEPDDAVFAHAVSRGFALVSADLGFGNVLRFEPGSHAGIIIVRLPDAMSVSAIGEAVTEALLSLRDEEIDGCLVVIEPGRIRLRRPR